MSSIFFIFFFFNDTATTEIYTLSLHDALPISSRLLLAAPSVPRATLICAFSSAATGANPLARDRKSTRLNSSHLVISYAVFCLKKKKKKKKYKRAHIERLKRHIIIIAMLDSVH